MDSQLLDKWLGEPRRRTDSSRLTRNVVVPYVTSWSVEQPMPFEVIEREGGGVAYADEIFADRDAQGVLWQRACSNPHEGRPEFGRVHTLRQRRAMRRLLCQVCGKAAHQSDEGMLWLLPDHRPDWAGWPEGMANVEPPICRSCVGTSLRLCPELRRGAVAVRVREFPIVGVRGALYRPGRRGLVAVDEVVVGYDDPAIRWVRAVGLVRELHGCVVVPAEG